MLIFLCVILALVVIADVGLVFYIRELASAKKRIKEYANGLERTVQRQSDDLATAQKDVRRAQDELVGAHKVIESIVKNVPDEPKVKKE